MKSIKIFFVLPVLAIFACSLTESAKNISENSTTNQEKQYVLGTNDVPLFSGLEFVEEDSANFDTMIGNIVISKYVGDFKLKPVKDFYLQTLPQLGWILVDNKADKISFKREKDKLEIKLSYASRGLYVRFLVSSVLQ
jgi:hypothetical protein